MEKAQFGMIGLGTMGSNLVLNIADKGISVCGYDLDLGKRQQLLEVAEGQPVQTADTTAELVAALERPRRIMMMVPAGKIVDAVIDEIAPLLDRGDILIDGGNSHYTDTDRRIGKLAGMGIEYTGMGISGGEEGARFGPSLMPGGTKESYAHLKDILEKIAAQTDEGACVTLVGNGSAGHYTKMVHNGIEYAIMQMICDVYGILKNALGCDNDELHAIFHKWNQGRLQSFLVEISAKIFLQPDDRNPSNRLVDVVLDRAAQKGTGMWTSVSALNLHIPTPTIDEAVVARDLSVFKAERMKIAAFRKSPVENAGKPDKEAAIKDLEDALYFGMMTSYMQGFHLLQAASMTYNYGVDMAEVARIWKGGCIIRSIMLNDIRKTYLADQNLINLVFDKDFYLALQEQRQGLVNSLKIAMDYRVATPALSSSLQYAEMWGTGRLSSNLLQAQRDFFGAHTYERTDAEGSFHTEWN